jgi:putative endonuclease
MFYAYVLKSQATGTHYYGSSGDLDRRLKDHNSGKVKYTKGKRPWALAYSESYETRSEAYKRELFFKSIEGYLFLKKLGIIVK